MATKAPTTPPSNENRERLVNMDEASNYLGCSRRNINQLIRNGQLHPVDISALGKATKRRTWRIRVRDLDAFIRQRTFKATPVDEAA